MTLALEPQDLFPVIRNLAYAELCSMRGPGHVGFAIHELQPKTPIGAGGLEADSLEMLTLAASVNEMFHLSEARVEESLLQYRSLGAWTSIVAACWPNTSRRVTFRTSGSTGQPKRCMHEWAHLAQEIEYLVSLFSESRRVLSFAPAHHIYGFLWGVLLPKVLKAPVKHAAATPLGSLESMIEPGDLLISHPEHWRYLARSGTRFPSGVHGVVSTAPCPKAVIEDLLAAGLASMTEVYGSSETGGIGLRRGKDDPYQLFPYWSRATHGGAEEIQRESASGIEGHVASMPDRVSWADDRSFHVQGRRDGAVQVGGVNVFPSSIADRIAFSLPCVAECAVRLTQNGGSPRLKAFVVLQDGFNSREAEWEIRAWIRTNLTAPEQPKAITFGAALPRTASGKLCDWEISGTASQRFAGSVIE